MKRSIVGYTGFVGSNIYAAGEFDAGYNSKNIKEAFGSNPDLLIYAGLKAEKYLANKEPERDMNSIIQAERNIAEINPRKLVLISTIDVFAVPKDVDENSEIDSENLQAYGYNRYLFEAWARENYPDALIIRLPGLFGKNIRKNFIYDYMNVIPFMLKEDTFKKLAAKDPELKKYYEFLNSGFYKVSVPDEDKEDLKNRFRRLGFSALNFTDSRSVYQFYNLERLWRDIQTALAAEITLWHPATEPVSVKELYKYLTGQEFINELNETPADYNYKTIHDAAFGGSNGYICSKTEVLRDIKKFTEAMISANLAKT